MAQLVKLQDYISRYENDLSRYPSQFIRLKKYQWDRMKIQWENGLDHLAWQQKTEEIEPEEEKKFASLFRLFSSRKNESTTIVNSVEVKNEEEEDDLGFQPNLIYNPTTIEQLRKLYLDQLFHFQIKWASST